MRRPPRWLVPVLALLAGLVCAASAVPASAAGPIRFREVSKQWGLAFRHHNGSSGRRYMVETMGAGVAVFDYDRDGDDDVFFVDSGSLPGYNGEKPRSVLFRNDGGGHFVDVTERAGIAVSVYGQGAVAADVDGDGELDLYVTGFGPNELFHNRGDGTFEEVPEAAGAADPGVGASASFADVDRDGDLDLYSADYVDFALDHNVICGNERRGIRTYCHPDAYDGLPDHFYQNQGDGTFVEDTTAAGLEQDLAEGPGKGLGVLFTDIDGDGWLDLYVANDMTENLLFRNKGDGTFEEVGLLSGTAFSDRGNPEASMGVDVGDLDGDGRSEIMLTHIDDQTNAVYSYKGSWVFTDSRYPVRLAEPSVGKVGFGVLFADFDQDADLDVAVANGHIIDNIELFDKNTTYKQPNQVFANQGTGRFAEVDDAGLDVVRSSRGSADGDLDGDGDLDLLINNSNDWCEVYENVTPDPGAWLQVDLAQARGNRWAVGGRVTVEAKGLRPQWREVRTASSYLSQSASTLHFGLGDATRVDRLTARWPGGEERIVEGLPVGVRVRLLRN